MFLLSGVVLTAGPANAASTETVPYTYTVKVPVTKTVWEYQVVKSVVNKRTVYTYEKVAKTKTEYRIETRTGYREAPVKAADKPAAAEYKVQVATTAAFTNVTKEIIVTPSAPGTNKVNLSNQLSGSVGDTTFVRVVAKNAAGKSTPGKVAKLAFGETSRYNYNVQVPYTATGTRVKDAGYYTADYNRPTYGYTWGVTANGYDESYVVSEGYYTYGITQAAYSTWGEISPAGTGSYYVSGYTDSYWVSGYHETYWVSGYNQSYECGYWTTARPKYPSRYISETCTRWISGYNSTRWVPGYTQYYWVSGYTEYYSYPATYGVINVPATWGYTYVPATWGTRWVPATYGNVWSHTGYESRWVEPTYENYTYAAERTETRVAIVNGWKAATN
jgi:hypothetical protein